MFRFLAIAILVVVLVIILANWRINAYSDTYVYSDVDKIPFNKVGMVLGTSKRLVNGQSNLYFRYRIEAASRLYRAGKIRRILVSGDNGSRYYNEAMDMKKALVDEGVPEEVIVLDYAGFRTLDSVVRSNKVFGQKNITIISQAFHNKRAVYIARTKGINAIGYNARDVHVYHGLKTKIREKLARVKVFLDLYLLNTQPKFLGDAIEIK